jgi:hypothetical protein
MDDHMIGDSKLAGFSMPGRGEPLDLNLRGRQTASGVSGVTVPRLDQEDVGFTLRARAMLNPAGNDEHLAGRKLDIAITASPPVMPNQRRCGGC